MQTSPQACSTQQRLLAAAQISSASDEVLDVMLRADVVPRLNGPEKKNAQLVLLCAFRLATVICPAG
jgi:hypothetical protein